MIVKRAEYKDEATVHLVYAHGNSISTPDAIGRHLAARLSDRYRVRLYDWQEFARIHPGQNDILIGHACPIYGTVFRRNAKLRGWRRVLLLSPFCQADDRLVGFYDRIIKNCDLYLAITGNYWFDSIGASGYAHWLPKMRHIDLAVDRKEFPTVKCSFNSPGKRRFLYIGRDGGFNHQTKNTEYLVALSTAMRGTDFGWMGTTRWQGAIAPLGFQDFRRAESREIVAGYDFLITLGKSDPNPTTILEAMAWGLIPVCTPQSGYVGYNGIINVPLDDLPSARRILEELQNSPEELLLKKQQENWLLLDNYFNWDRVAGQVIDAIESQVSPDCLPATFQRKFELVAAELTNPIWLSLLNPKKLTKRLRMLSFGSGERASVYEPRAESKGA